MSRIALTLNLVVGLIWLAAATALIRRPPAIPSNAGPGARRAGWGLLALVALGAGAWGLPLSTTTASDRQPPEAMAGRPADAVSWSLRTPVAVVERNLVRDGEGRTIRDERRETLQVPLALLIFLAAVFWIRWRAGGSNAGTRDAVTTVLAACALLGACRADHGDEGRELEALRDIPRPERTILDVPWDTLARVHSGVDDTLLFSAGVPAADETGFVVLDYYGSRVARFDWDGNVRDFLGRRGGGPGEFLGARQLELDRHGILWVLDGDNARISGFDRQGQLVEEVSLDGLPIGPSRFTVNPDGSVFRFMLNVEELVPYEMDRAGTVRMGNPIHLQEGRHAFGLALQGLLTHTDSPDGWVYALGAGDGILPMRGNEWDGRRWRYPEAVPFPRQDRMRGRSGNTSVTTSRLSSPTFSALSVDTRDGILYVVFMGSTDEAGRLLERWELETGRYLDTVLLPRAGQIAVWEDRIVLTATNPEPEVLVLRAPWSEAPSRALAGR